MPGAHGPQWPVGLLLGASVSPQVAGDFARIQDGEGRFLGDRRAVGSPPTALSLA